MRQSFPHSGKFKILPACLLLLVGARGTVYGQSTLPSAAVQNECESTLGSCYPNPPAINPQLTVVSIPAPFTTSPLFSTSSPGTINGYSVYAPNPNGETSGLAAKWPFIGARTSHGVAPGAIDVWGTCTYINNTGTSSYFVPFNTANEWNAFLANVQNNTQNNVSLVPCARATPFVITPSNPPCVPQPPSITTNLPYAPNQTVLSYTANFSCTNGMVSYTDKVLATYTAAIPPGNPAQPPVWTQTLVDSPVTVMINSSAGNGSPSHGGGCFVAGSLVLMADGRVKPIETLHFGDRVRNAQGGVNMVLRRAICALPKGCELYGFDGGKPMVTAQHPFVMAEGFAAIDPDALLHKCPYFEDEIGTLSRLQAGITLLSPTGPRRIESVQKYPVTDENTAYDLVLDGDQTFFVEGFAVRSQHDNAHAIRYLPHMLRDTACMARAAALSAVYLSAGMVVSPMAALAGGGSTTAAAADGTGDAGDAGDAGGDGGGY